MFKRIIMILALIFGGMNQVFAEKDCPFGLTDDPAPGQCGRYVDANGDNICDRSQETSQSGGASTGVQNMAQNEEQPAPEESAVKEIPENVEKEPETVSDTEPSQSSEYSTEPETISEQKEAGQSAVETATQPEKLASPRGPDYHPWLWLLLIAFLATAGEIWQKKDTKKIAFIQTFWNWLLLVTFLACSLTGIYFILPSGIRPTNSIDISYWHTVTGLVFIYIGLYHAIRRAVCLIRGPKNCVKKNPCC